MNYIVLDLEWNQCPSGKADEVSALPFEIIEIGAYCLDGEHQVLGSFREVIRPQVYRSLHYKTKEVISLRDIDFEGARAFPEVLRDFLSWCGQEPAFCTWGPGDLMELQRNMDYYGIPIPFPFPLLYYDIQKIYSIVYEDRKSRRSLSCAVDTLDIPMDVPFHNALSDAHYTSLIMQRLPDSSILENSSVDYFSTPENRKQEILLQYATYQKFVSRPFLAKTQAMKDRKVASTVCYLCGKPAPKKIRWFSVNSHNYFCLAFCEEHGYLKGKVRLRQRRDGRFYAVKTLKLISPEEADSIRTKKEIQKIRRR